jgi:NAD-dependent deacetylase
MRKLVVLSGAGMSQESGISTFRDANGLWENFNVTEVASPLAWKRDMDLVLRFYNQRRKNVLSAQPNQGHILIAELEKEFDVQIITQNVDDLHERAGSTKVLHLHGEIRKARSTLNPNFVYNIDGAELNRGDLCELGSQLRPHIVWFGEEVPEIHRAIKIVETADLFLVIGTSLEVYPAAGLLDFISPQCKTYLIDPGMVSKKAFKHIEVIPEKAGLGMKIFRERVLG